MSFVRGSHDAFHPYERFLKNAMDFDYCGHYVDRVEVMKTLGKAGDIYLFDSNGMHRGTRSLGRRRDVLFVEYTADGNQNNIWGSAAEKLAVDDLPDGERLIAPFLAMEPKWKRRRLKKRKRPTWAESLEDPSVWINSQ